MIRSYRQILGLLGPHDRRAFFVLAGLSLAMGVVELLGVLSVVPFIALAADPDTLDRSATLSALYGWLGFDGRDRFLIALGLATFAMLTVTVAMRTLTLYALTRFVWRQSANLGARLVAHYLRQPYEWALTRHPSEISANALAEVEEVVNGPILGSMRFLAYGAVTLCLVGLLIATDPGAALAMAAVLGTAYGSVFFAMRRRLKRVAGARLKANRAIFQTLHEALSGLREVKLMQLTPRYIDRFAGHAERLAALRAQVSLMRDLPRSALEMLAFGSMIALVVWIMWSRDGDMRATLPVLALYAFAGARLFPVLQRLYKAVVAVRAGQPALDALCRDLAKADPGKPTVAQIGTPTAADKPLTPATGVELREVIYRFPNAERPALEGASLSVPTGAKVAIVGPTGAGKSTAVDVLLGLLDPHAGERCLDGEPLDSESIGRWQRAVGYVPQSIYLADDSVAANIAFGEDPAQIDHASVRRAARLAQAHRFISNLPQGYASEIGDRGVRLSGGQRQRIGIARALYRDPPVLVLDEATNALDAETERAVLAALNGLSARKTVLMVTHRLQSVEDFDLIHVMVQGRVVDSGNYVALQARNRHFREAAGAPI